MLQIGRTIEHWREHRGLTQQELGTRAGMSQGLVSRYEHGHVKGMPSRRLEQLARALNIPLHKLFRQNDAFPVESDTEVAPESVET